MSLFQSTHPRGVRRQVGKDDYGEFTISIHAPTWGATRIDDGACVGFKISIHAPTWGATEAKAAALYDIIISIHAPTWGAT